MTTATAKATKTVRAWDLDEGTEVRFEDGTIHRVRTVSKFTNPDGGKRKIYFDRVAEPLEVGFDTMVEVME